MSHGEVPRSWMLFMLLFTALVLGVGVTRGESSIENYLKLRKSKKILEETVSVLEHENQSLSDEIVRLKKSKQYAKKVLKEKYHITDPDEHIEFFAD